LPALHRISDRVFWLPPGPPDRPSLCAVVGERRTLMLDAGASPAHARLFLDGLAAERVAPPGYVALTHSHWDHVFGATELDAHVIAQTLTADALTELAATDWSDEALDRRVAAGAVSPAHAANVKEELPAPREVQVASADIVFRDGLDIELGAATVRVRHVGGDHAADSSVMYVEPDGVLFLGDCLYESPDGGLTPEPVVPLHAAIRRFGAELYVDGHSESVMSQVELEKLVQ
jgi:glyoxylase-like metal-dependent hydrolase (beta-lactamase superfamily II)